MKLIKQQHESGCGVACFAMLTNMSYRKAFKILFNQKWWQPFLKGKNVAHGTKIMWLSEKLERQQIRNFLTRDHKNLDLSKRMLLVVPSNIGHHGVIWDPQQRKILDPTNGGSFSQEYCFNKLHSALVILND